MRGRRVLGLVAALVAAAVPTSAAAASDSWSAEVVRFEAAPGATLVVEGVGELRGAVEIRRTSGGVAVIDDLPLEDYLLGIAEVPSTWPAAALEAQAVAARTYALHAALARSSAPHRRAGADICATQSCQVYEGVARERRDTGGAWAAAVRRTANRVLLHRGQLILPLYGSSNGGRSDPGGAPYLPAVDDPDDRAVSPWARWTSTIPLTDVARAVPGAGALAEVVRTGSVVVLRREQPDGTVVDQGMAPLAFRKALNGVVPTPKGLPVPVPSARFVARTAGGSAVLDGGGYGHLTGMSQYGALGKARRGFTADQILTSYYGTARPETIDPRRLPRTIRVAMALDHGPVTVRPAGGAMRVLGDGVPIAQLSAGTWRAAPTSGRIAVSGDHPALSLAAARLSPQLVRLELSAAARVVVQDPAARDLGVLPAGAHDVAVAAVPVGISADAGGGRTATAAVPLDGAAPPPPTVGATAAPVGPSTPVPTIGDPLAVAAGPTTSPRGGDPDGGGKAGAAAFAVLALVVVGGTPAWLFRRRLLNPF